MIDSEHRPAPTKRPAYGLRETEFYLPAMWPMDLQNAIVDWFTAWRWRRQMRHLLQLEARGLARLGDFRDAVKQGAAAPLRDIAARNAARRRDGMSRHE